MLRFSNAVSAIVTVCCASFLFAETQYPLTILDGMGQEITVKKAPKTISSKTLFTDEILLSMLDKQQISSLTNLASEVTYSNIATIIPENMPLLDLNVEAIIGNYPDLVFAANWSDAGKIEQIKQAGIPVYLVNTPFTVEDIQAEIIKLGYILNAEQGAADVVAQMNSQLMSYQTLVNDIKAQNWVALDYNTWGTSSGVDTTWQAVLDNSGIINGSAAYEQGAFGQVAMSKELIIEVDPDILFLPGWIYGEDGAAKAFYQQVIADPALSNVKAIKNGRVYQIPENLRGTYSQYLADTVGYVVNSVHASIN